MLWGPVQHACGASGPPKKDVFFANSPYVTTQQIDRHLTEVRFLCKIGFCQFSVKFLKHLEGCLDHNSAPTVAWMPHGRNRTACIHTDMVRPRPRSWLRFGTKVHHGQ